ncbi:hypothetical protein BU26DRAFT_112261 [Trematosphaeria pertusa]|uniref:Uncharacterized protein n=1 Tax=Trematosphaeria pertusa TaxID=390896 RepID=A0A6A6I288_9PLEO|nr:uncharacterized protein BU26DRAFT_112261 [Trematosphaeria pertusa]KAF2243983.1 hypothetical protein BU26DRAFT_112261 [Trematosphaeria pertusa]
MESPFPHNQRLQTSQARATTCRVSQRCSGTSMFLRIQTMLIHGRRHTVALSRRNQLGADGGEGVERHLRQCIGPKSLQEGDHKSIFLRSRPPLFVVKDERVGIAYRGRLQESRKLLRCPHQYGMLFINTPSGLNMRREAEVQQGGGRKCDYLIPI